jgi:hypothetical protein
MASRPQSSAHAVDAPSKKTISAAALALQAMHPHKTSPASRRLPTEISAKQNGATGALTFVNVRYARELSLNCGENGALGKNGEQKSAAKSKWATQSAAHSVLYPSRSLRT